MIGWPDSVVPDSSAAFWLMVYRSGANAGLLGLTFSISSAMARSVCINRIVLKDCITTLPVPWLHCNRAS